MYIIAVSLWLLALSARECKSGEIGMIPENQIHSLLLKSEFETDWYRTSCGGKALAMPTAVHVVAF